MPDSEGIFAKGPISVDFTLCGKPADSPDYCFWYDNRDGIARIAGEFGGKLYDPIGYCTVDFRPTVRPAIRFEDRATFKWEMLDRIAALRGVEGIDGVTVFDLLEKSRASNGVERGNFPEESDSGKGDGG